MRQPLAILVALLTLHSGLALGGEPDSLELKWDELAPHVAGRQVALVLPGGAHISGKALAVEPDGLRMRVRSTSDRKAQPKGEHVIPRQSISTLSATHYEKKWRLTGALTGPAAVLAGVAANRPSGLEGTLVIAIPVIAAVGAVGAAFGGYYIGKRADKRVTTIRITP